MGENTKIQWAHHTFNPWRGCTKVAAGCANCYAETQAKRNPKTLGEWGPDGTRVVASEAMWREPVKWDRIAATLPQQVVRPGSLPIEHIDVERPRVFCASLADVFEDWRGCVVDSRGNPVMRDDADDPRAMRRLQRLDDVRARLFRTIDATPNLDWLLLTKRPENVRRMWPIDYIDDGGDCDDADEAEKFAQGTVRKRRGNVWLGTSIACQEDADRNIPALLKCRDLAAKLFLSIEPLVGPVDLEKIAGPDGRERGLYASSLHADHDDRYFRLIGAPIDWVIVGGESGPKARPCNVAWVRSIVRQCKEAGVLCFVKQLGSRPVGLRFEMDQDGRPFCVEGDCFRGRPTPLNRNGSDPAEWPEDLRVREVPS